MPEHLRRRFVVAALAAGLLAGACTETDEDATAPAAEVTEGRTPQGAASPSVAPRPPLVPAAVSGAVREVAQRHARILDGLAEGNTFRPVVDPAASPPPGTEAVAQALAEAGDTLHGLSAEAGGLTADPATRQRVDRLLAPWEARVERATRDLAAGDAGPAEAVVADPTLRSEVVGQVRLLVAADRAARAGILAKEPLEAVTREIEGLDAAALRDLHGAASIATIEAASTGRRILRAGGGLGELRTALRLAARASEELADALAEPAS